MARTVIIIIIIRGIVKKILKNIIKTIAASDIVHGHFYHTLLHNSCAIIAATDAVMVVKQLHNCYTIPAEALTVHTFT